MTPESVMALGTEAMKVALALAAPLLLAALISGLVVSLLQAATQINEMTLSFIPKILAVVATIIIAGPSDVEPAAGLHAHPVQQPAHPDRLTVLTFDSAQLTVWLSHYFWPLLRILALISTAPIFSEKQISKKVKIGLGGLIVILIAPTLPASNIPIFSAAGLWLAIQQILIGVALGLTMQFAFAAVRLAGEVIGMQMGLSFATFFDPSGGPNMPVLARLLNLLAMLLFLSFDGHLWLISLLADSFHTLPIQTQPLNGNGFWC